MPHIFVTVWYPTDKVPEIVKIWFQSLKKFPTDESLGETAVDAVTTATKDGLKTVSVYVPKKGKLEESLTRIDAMMAMFQPIHGFSYSTERYTSAEESLAAIGMKMPE